MNVKQLVILFALFAGVAANGQDRKTDEIMKRVELLNSNVFVNAGMRDSATLDMLISAHLSYGHSGGKVESKREMISHAVHSSSVYSDFSMDSASVDFDGRAAVVRHKLHFVENGKPARLAILQVWADENGSWKLLARQAVHL